MKTMEIVVRVNHIPMVPSVDQGGQIEPSQSVLIREVQQSWDHPGDSSLDCFECFNVLLEIWFPDDDSVFQCRPD